MAPIAIGQNPKLEVAFNNTNYKEQATGPKSYSKDAEEQGTETQPAAKVH